MLGGFTYFIMANWKIIFEENGSTIELIIKAKSFSDTHIDTQIRHPCGQILSIRIMAPNLINNKTKKNQND